MSDPQSEARTIRDDSRSEAAPRGDGGERTPFDDEGSLESSCWF